MGSGRWNADDWKGYTAASSYDSKATHEIFTNCSIDKKMDPKTIVMDPKGGVRESRDSADNPLSTPIILALDVTGSMGIIADTIARKGLNTLCTEIYKHRPVTDPHVMLMGIGDIEYDTAPLQVSQFEADIRIVEQLEKIFLEHGGGGNHYESYALAWYFAAMYTSCDAFEKRGKKGYLFTIGDEEPTPYLPKDGLEKFLGAQVQSDLKLHDILTMASRQWEIFHIIVEEGSHCRYAKDKVFSSWADVLGQRALHMSDHTKIGEIVTAAIRICEGHKHDEVVKDWDGSTAMVVSKAIKDLTASKTSDSGVVTL